MKDKIKKTLRAMTGMTLLPIFVAIFMCDRFILIFLFWMESKRLKIWLDDVQMFMHSALRVVTLVSMCAMYKLIKMWLF